MTRLSTLSITILTLAFLVSVTVSGAQSRPSLASQQSDDGPLEIRSFFVKGETLSYMGYDIAKLNKKVKLKYTSGETEVSYAVLKKGNKVLAKFDGTYSGVGNATDFGLFSFFGREAKQLVVSQSVPRGGRYWVVNLSPEFRVVYDSRAYRVGREDLGVLDIDKDGRYEILQEVTAFYGFDNFNSAETPLPLVIFKYDDKAGQYLPANDQFQAYSLHDTERAISRLTSDENGYLSSRLDIVLEYIYAGKEKEGLDLFERIYEHPDKDKTRARVMAVLRNDPVYRFIYRKK